MIEWDKYLKIKNLEQAIVPIGAIHLNSGEEREFKPFHFSENQKHTIEQLEKAGLLSVVYVDKTQELEPNDDFSFALIDSENHEHVVFNGIIEVETLDTLGRSIEVEELSTDSSAIEVAPTIIDEQEAVDFLGQHWKTLEVEVAKVKSIKKLNYYSEVAKKLGLGGKKVEIIENRIKEIRG